MSELFDDCLNEYDPDTNYFESHISENHVFSSFDSIDNFTSANQALLKDPNFISIFNQNIRSFNANLDDFLLLFDENSFPDCLIFSETWHDGYEPILIPNYTGFHTVRQLSRSGGISIFVKNSLNSELIKELSYVNESIETCTVKISNENSCIFICGVYRPHSGTIENFTFCLENILENQILNGADCLIGGDFNIDLSSNGGGTDLFSDMLRAHHFIQTISDITRPSLNNSEGSLLDHLWINNISNFNSGIIKSGVTDHHTTFIFLPFKCNTNTGEKIKISFRDCSLENQTNFEIKIREFNWNSIKTNNPETYMENFISSLNVMYQESFPLKTKFVTQRYFKNPWHNKEVKKISEARKKYHKLFLLNLVTREQYTTFRNKVTNLIRKYKEKYYLESFTRNYGNAKKTWETIKELSNGNKYKSSIDKIFFNRKYYYKNTEIATLFNRFFVSIAHDLAASLPTPNHSPYLYVQPNDSNPPIELNPVSPVELSCIIQSMKVTKTDVNEISVKLFKKYHIYFIDCLCDLINLCFTSGIFPDCLKNAIIIPIYKKGISSDMSNYRPIALLPFISKILERCIFDRICHYASLYNLLVPTQFGFRKGLSTKDAIVSITEKIYDAFNMGDGAFNINIYIDFQKAFDTVDHTILLNKLFLYGITGSAHTLLKNYLSNRFQSVRIGNALSPPLQITKSVPQGSVLGSLLFLFAINDLPNVSNIFTSILYADDLALSLTCTSINECNELCNGELKKIFEWSVSNKLSINYGHDKSYYMIHSFRNLDLSSLSISINNNCLENLSKAKYLGIILDPHLKYKHHIEYIAEKISKSIGILFKLKKLKTPQPILKQVYYSLIYSLLNYNICSYAGTYNIHLNRLFLLQKRAVRLICNESFLAHTDPLFFRTGILKIHDIYKLNVALYMFDARHSGIFDRNHPYETRSYHDLTPFNSRLRVTENSLRVSGPNIWSRIPQDIRDEPSISIFKSRYKKHLLSNYDHND